MATIEELRLKILDRPQIVVGEYLGKGDGIQTSFRLFHYPLQGTISMTVDGEEVAHVSSGAGVTAAIAPPEGTLVGANYDYAVFTDSDLQGFLDANDGNLARAAGDALTGLISDSFKLRKWSRGDNGIDYDRLRRELKGIADRFHRKADGGD